MSKKYIFLISIFSAIIISGLVLGLVNVNGFNSISQSAQAQSPTCTLYVSQDGSGNFITIQQATSQSQPGDVICVKPGNYYERIQITRSGQAGKPIVFKAEGKVVNRGFTIEADYIHIIGFEITDTIDEYKDGQGIWLIGKHCEIKDNYIHDVMRWGILAYYNTTPDGPETSHCLISNNKIVRSSTAGIQVYGQYNIVENNEISHTIQYPPGAEPRKGADADGIRFFGKGHIIRGNYIHDLTFDDPENIDPHIDGFQTYGDTLVSDILIEGNYVDLPAPPLNTSCQYLTFSGAPVKDITIQNNIFITDAVQRCPLVVRGISGHISQNVKVLNNTFVRTNQGHADVIAIYADGVTVKNNIFYHQNSSNYSYYKSREGVTNLEVGNNLFYTANGNPTGSPYPNDLWQQNPKFVDYQNHDFHLQSDSPAIDAGVVFSDITTDHDGNSRPQGNSYDIGAYEYTGTDPTPQPEIIFTKSVDKSSTQPGDTLTYTLQYRNTSQAEARNIVLTDNIPAGARYVAGSATGNPVLTGSQLKWTIESLGAGQAGEVGFGVIVD